MITLGLKEPVRRMFPVSVEVAEQDRGNEIVIDFGDPGLVMARFLTKRHGAEMRLAQAEMTSRHADSFRQAYGLEGTNG